MTYIEKMEEKKWHFEDELEKINSERDMQSWWVEFLRWNRWNVETEVSPRGSRDRADLIIQCYDYPPIGVELKYEPTGRNMGKALHQINDKYRNQRYPGFGKVNLWAVSVFHNNTNHHVYRPLNNTKPGYRELFCFYGIGWMGMSLQPSIDFSYSDKRCKVGLGDANYRGSSRIGFGDFKVIERKVANSVGGQARRSVQGQLTSF